MIGGMLGRINTAEQMTVEQLQQALDSGSLPAYIGVPILQEKMQMRDRAMAIPMGQQLAQQPPIAEEILSRARSAPNVAQMVEGIDQLPTQLRPDAGMAQGGIVALAGGGRLSPYAFEDEDYDYGIDQSPLARFGRWLAKKANLQIKEGVPLDDALESLARPADQIPQAQAAPQTGLFHRDPPTQWRETDRMEPSGFRVEIGGVGSPEPDPVGAPPPAPDKAPPKKRQGAGITALPSNLTPTSIGAPGALDTPTEGIAAQPVSGPLQQYIDLLMQGREQTQADKDAARNRALLTAGLGMMAGQSPYALQNIGAGAMAGMQDYNKSIEDQRKESRDALKEAAGLAGTQATLDMNERKIQQDAEYQTKRLLLEEKRIAAAARDSGVTQKDISGATTRIFLELSKGEIMPDDARYAALMEQSRIMALQSFGLLPIGIPAEGDGKGKHLGTIQVQ